MKHGLVKIEWNNIDNIQDSDISYFLFLEGKTIETIAVIRGREKSEIQKHIIDGKIKYRFLSKSNNVEEFFKSVMVAGKQDKLRVLNSLDDKTKENLVKHIKENYVTMSRKEKEAAVWIIGELRAKEAVGILIKASVHKFSNVRRLAVSALSKLEDPSLETTLIRALEDSNPQVVMYAINSLGKIKGKKGKNKILEIKNTTEKAYLKKAAEEYIKVLEEEILQEDPQEIT